MKTREVAGAISQGVSKFEVIQEMAMLLGMLLGFVSGEGSERKNGGEERGWGLRGKCAWRGGGKAQAIPPDAVLRPLDSLPLPLPPANKPWAKVTTHTKALGVGFQGL